MNFSLLKKDMYESTSSPKQGSSIIYFVIIGILAIALIGFIIWTVILLRNTKCTAMLTYVIHIVQ